jgi:hypothetical protein
VQFSSKWMKKLGKNVGEKTTSHNKVIADMHDEILAAKLTGVSPHVNTPSVLGDD